MSGPLSPIRHWMYAPNDSCVQKPNRPFCRRDKIRPRDVQRRPSVHTAIERGAL